jgi:hypothetical protein
MMTAFTFLPLAGITMNKELSVAHPAGIEPTTELRGQAHEGCDKETIKNAETCHSRTLKIQKLTMQRIKLYVSLYGIKPYEAKSYAN